MAAHRLATTISCHAWGPDRSMLAICPNNTELWIYVNCLDPDSSNWERKWVLKQHDFVISGVDWCAATNKIVTCSHDRNAFVWTYDAAGSNSSSSSNGKTTNGSSLSSSAAAVGAGAGTAAGIGGTWTPQVVVLNINRAALDVKWSPDGQKFAVASGAKVVMICFYDAGNNWWISKQSKKHKSTALTCAWHPNSQVIASVATDYRCRVMSAYLEDVDASQQPAQFGESLPDAGDVITEFETTRAWLNDCAWSPSGMLLAFVGHDSLLHIVAFAPDPSVAPIIQSIKCPTLPGMRVLFLSETALVTAGHSMNPELFIHKPTDGLWHFSCSIDRRPDAGSNKAVAAGGVAAARAMFASKVTKGQSSSTSSTEESWTKHQNAITYLQAFMKTKSGAIRSFSTSGNDGRVVIWDLVALALPDVDLVAAGIA